VSPLWLLPGLVLLIGGAAVLALLRVAADEARLLAEELSHQGEITAAISRVHGSIRVLEGRFKRRR
jgi:cytochrome c-type biogenesis protein CcmH/NrfF